MSAYSTLKPAQLALVELLTLRISNANVVVAVVEGAAVVTLQLVGVTVGCVTKHKQCEFSQFV
jgi:hypothetical protein